MPSKALVLFPKEKKILTDFGQRLRLARLRRHLPMIIVAARVGISRMTLSKAENGDAAVGLGVYLRLLAVLQLEGDFNLLATDDKLGRRLQDLEIDTPRRAPRRKTSKNNTTAVDGSK